MPVIGNTDATFGTTDESYGLFQNVSVSESTNETQVRGANGDIVSVSYHGNELTMSGQYTALGALNVAGGPGAGVGDGTALTFTDTDLSGNWYVTESEKAKEKEGFATVNFSAKQYPNLGSPA